MPCYEDTQRRWRSKRSIIKGKIMIERKPFGDYELVTIQDKDLEVSITNLGATVTSIKVEGEEILLNTGEALLPVLNINELKLIGIHNYENVMAAVVMAYGAGIPLASIKKILTGYNRTACGRPKSRLGLYCVCALLY